MNFAKIATFIFCYLGMFTTLMVLMPTEFITQTWNTSYEDKVAGAYYSAQNVTHYANTLSFNLSFGDYYASTFGLPDGQQIQFWWGVAYPYAKIFQVRHLTDNFWGWWWGRHLLTFDIGETAIIRSDLEESMDSETNSSFYWVECDHIRTSIFFISNRTEWSLTDSWDNNELRIVTSYEMDWNATSVSAWTVLSSLLSFQSPNLGITGIGGAIFDAVLALPFWIMTAVAVIMLIQSMIPFIKGLVG